jgi:heme-degrading monooxygenase HmoA
MIARVGTTQVHPHKVDEGQRLWEEQIIPAMKKQKGFKNVFVLGDSKTHKVITVSIWESVADAEAWEKCVEQNTLKGKLKDKATSVPKPDVYEVKLYG